MPNSEAKRAANRAYAKRRYARLRGLSVDTENATEKLPSDTESYRESSVAENTETTEDFSEASDTETPTEDTETDGQIETLPNGLHTCHKCGDRQWWNDSDAWLRKHPAKCERTGIGYA